MQADLWGKLVDRARNRGAEPFIAYREGRDRTELSARTAENGAAKIANALGFEFMLDDDARIAVHLPWHWQRSLWIAGIAATGAQCLAFGDPADADLVIGTPENGAALRDAANCDVVVASLHPLGLTVRDSVPPGCLDGVVVTRTQPDSFRAMGSYLTDVPDVGATDECTLVICTDPHAPQSWAWALGAPLLSGGSIVMTSDADNAERIAEEERATRIVRI